MKQEKILVIKLGAFGDFIAMMSRMLWIRKRHPEAALTLMTGKAYIQLAKSMEIFDSYIIDNRASYWNLADKLRLCREVRAGEFDVVYDLQATSRTRNVYFGVFKLLNKKEFIWIDTPHNDERRVIPGAWFRRAQVEVREASLGEAPIPTKLEFMKADRELMESLPRPYVLMIPGCSPTHPHKRWPAEHFAALAQMLAKHGIHSVVIGTKAESAEVNRVAEASPMVVSLLNRTKMTDIADLARNALVTVGNDTGPSHIATRTGAPLIGLFATRTKPCSLKGEKTFNIISKGTIDLISPNEVWEVMLPYISAFVQP